MTGSGTGGKDPEAAADVERDDARAGDSAAGWQGEPEPSMRRFPASRVSRAERDRMVKEARAVTFPFAVRGYERRAVDRYVQEVNRLIAELEISSSSESAVRHALAEVSEETREILQRAHETADEVVLRARAKAADAVQEAEREAQEVRNTAQREAIELRELATQEAEELSISARRAAAELRDAAAREAAALEKTSKREAEQMRAAAKADSEQILRSAGESADQLLKSARERARELAASAETIWRERRRLIDDVRVLGEQLVAIGEAESQRFPRPAAAADLDSGRDAGVVSSADAELAATLHGAIEKSVAVGDAG
jgi:cell division septum initiation protein DivIVA